MGNTEKSSIALVNIEYVTSLVSPLYSPKPSQWYRSRRTQWMYDSTSFTTQHGFCTSCWKPIKCEHHLQSIISNNVWSTQIPKEYHFTAGLFVLLHKALECLFNMRVSSSHIRGVRKWLQTENHTQPNIKASFCHVVPTHSIRKQLLVPWRSYTESVHIIFK